MQEQSQLCQTPLVFPVYNFGYLICGKQKSECKDSSFYRHVSRQGKTIAQIFTHEFQSNVNMVSDSLALIYRHIDKSNCLTIHEDYELIQWDLVTNKTINFIHKSQYSYAELFIFPQTKFFCICTKLQLQDALWKFSNEFTITYYQYPLKQHENKPIASFSIIIPNRQQSYSYRILNKSSSVAIINEKQQTIHNGVQIWVCSMENGIKLWGFTIFSEAAAMQKLEDICEIKPGVIYINVSMNVYSGQVKFGRFFQTAFRLHNQDLLVAPGLRYQQVKLPIVQMKHRTQFSHFFRNIDPQYPRHYMDVNKLEFVGEASNQHMKWKITVPAYDDVEIWSQYDEKSGQLHIQEKRLLYQLKMTITYFMLQVCGCFDEDLLDAVVYLTRQS